MDDIFEADKRKPKTSRGAWVIALLSLAIMFLLLGLVLGVYVLSPDNSTKPQALMASPTASADAISWDGAENGSDEPIVLSVYENPVVDIAAAYSKSVVSVKATIMTNNVASSMTSDSESGQETQSEEIAFGSGFIFDSDGYILTNHHVVKDATELSIMMSDGTEYPAETIGSDSFNDIAVLKINAPDLSMIPIGDSDKVQVGEMAIAIGNPLGEDLSGSVTVGYISAVNRRVQSNAYLQTDAAINPGNSGGPLLNINGEVIGINALKSTLAGYDERGIAISSEGIGFAIPINRAIDVAHQLMDTGTVVRPGIGIQFSALSDDEAETLGVPAGAQVVLVVPGGPSDLAGVKVNDVIVGVNGEDVANADNLPIMMSGFKVGESITLDIIRSGEKMTLTLIVGDINQLTFE